MAVSGRWGTSHALCAQGCRWRGRSAAPRSQALLSSPPACRVLTAGISLSGRVTPAQPRVPLPCPVRRRQSPAWHSRAGRSHVGRAGACASGGASRCCVCGISARRWQGPRHPRSPGVRRRGTAVPAVPFLLAAGQGVLCQGATLPCPGTVPVSPAPLTARLTGKRKPKAGSFSVADGCACWRGSRAVPAAAHRLSAAWPCPSLWAPMGFGKDAGSGGAAGGVQPGLGFGVVCALRCLAGTSRGLRGPLRALGDRGDPPRPPPVRLPRRGSGARLVRGRQHAVQLVPPPARLPAHVLSQRLCVAGGVQ